VAVVESGTDDVRSRTDNVKDNLLNVSISLEIVAEVADVDRMLIGDFLDPRIFVELENRRAVEHFQLGKIWRKNPQTILLNVKFAEIAQLADLTRKFKQVVAIQLKLKYMR
jgi:hypothetical protein